MVEENRIQGRSLLLNIIAILINITGLVFIVLGYHPSFEEISSTFLTIGFTSFFVGLIVFLFLKGTLLMSYVARALLGGLFIVSGLIKANDPLGFSYKLEEYFEDGALAYRIKEAFGWETFSLEFLIDQALFLSVLICIIEIVLGVLMIVGGKIKLTSWLTVLMMIFFTFLTWHTKECDPDTKFKDVDTFQMSDPMASQKIAAAEVNEGITILSQDASSVTIAEMKPTQCVQDCGCFGDAMKGSIGRSLTPSESYWKDIVVLYFALIIFGVQWWIRPNTSRQNLLMIPASMVVVVFFSWLFGWNFPILFAIVCVLLGLWIKHSGGKVFGNFWGTVLIVTAVCLVFVIYVLSFSPLKDYRAYSVGSNLPEKMNDRIDQVDEKTFVYKNKETGEVKNMTNDEYLASKIWEDKTWEYDTMLVKVIVPFKLPSISTQLNPALNIEDITEYEKNFDFVTTQLDTNKAEYINIYSKEYKEVYPTLLSEFYPEDWDTNYVFQDTIMKLRDDFTEVNALNFLISEPKLLVVMSRELNDEKANWSRIEKLKNIAEQASKEGIPMMIMTSQDADAIKAFREKYQLNVPTFINDATEMKAITRSNPTLMYFENGTVIAKFPFRSTPSWDYFKENYLSK